MHLYFVQLLFKVLSIFYIIFLSGVVQEHKGTHLSFLILVIK